MELGGLVRSFRSPADAISQGIAYVTEDRKTRGILPEMTTGANLTLAYLAQFTRAGLLSMPRERAAASGAATRFRIRSAGLDQRAGTLSGGNQQKALLGRFMLLPRRVVVLDEPTRGVDVGARADIYALMNTLTHDGLGVLMISSDLPELLGMSDRVVVMRAGRTVGELSRQAATPEAVMAMATGA
jgi:ABC-type sugar transport system ATPase subunit